MADRPVLVIVNGVPGTGKTTLSKRISKDLGLPCIGKDDIKELLFDKMGTGDLKWSQDIGAGVADALFTFISTWVGRGRSIIAENAYYHELAAPRFKSIVQNTGVIFLEVYCKTDPEVRMKRFIERNENGERHPGHVDNAHYLRLKDSEAVYAPVAVGDIIEVDTTVFDTIDYSDIIRRIRTSIARHQKEGK